MMRKTGLFLVACIMFLSGISASAQRKGKGGTDPEPALTIPFLGKPPVIDGVIEPEEWKYAARITFFENYPVGIPRVVRQEQPLFYVAWDNEYLYVAMDSLYSSTNTIVASVSMNDNMKIIGNDCLEMMVCPATTDKLDNIEIPTYYFALNAIGTIWDAKFYPLLAETHNSWNSDAVIANNVDGTHWMCEMKIPFSALGVFPEDGSVWRMNFDRTYYPYNWVGWNARGGFNDARIGGDVTFSKNSPAIRLMPPDAVFDGSSELTVEVSNPASESKTVILKMNCTGFQKEGDPAVAVDKDSKEVTVAPGELKEIKVGTKKKLMPLNKVTFEATDGKGNVLFFTERTVTPAGPGTRFVKRVAPRVPMVYIWPRFLPSLERLAVIVDYTAWAKKMGIMQSTPSAQISVYPKGGESGKSLFEGNLKDFENNRGVWRHSTESLAEGEYSVKVKVTLGDEVLAEFDDWFEKRIFDWMVNKSGIGDKVPSPFTPLETDGTSVKQWGRTYTLNNSGLPSQVVSQERELLAGEMQLSAEIGGRSVPAAAVKSFAFTKKTPRMVYGTSSLKAGGLDITLNSSFEYDGLMKFEMTYKPAAGEKVDVSRLRLQVPLNAQYVKFYSASGDRQGTSIMGEVVSEKDGKVYDSFNNSRSVTLSPSFASLFWVGDYETSFCYAADNDRGWLLRDDAPAVEAYREGSRIVLWLNLVDKKTILDGPRTLEFAFQAGPVKPLPENWRGLQDGGNPGDAPVTIIRGGHSNMSGGVCFMHPGFTPETIERSRKNVERILEGGNKAVVGYQYWGTIPKGTDALRVFRSEWGIDKEKWDASRTLTADWGWKTRMFGENRDNYILMHVNSVPSYVDYISHSYERALQETGISGFYDDCGYPNPVYDEELGLGFVREDGRNVHSSGLWIYRDRWQRAAYLNFQYNRPNYHYDAQHVHAHYMPAYGFIGIWGPCERGFYNPFPDKDNLGFYGSLERYAAYNPARAFGQAGVMIGMASPEWQAHLFAQDTRNMMMLALLHEQDIGSWGHRDMRVAAALRHARNKFKPWEKDVVFHGYWKSANLVKTQDKDIVISLYTKNDGTLFIIGNTRHEDVKARIQPDWKKLKIQPEKPVIFNAETGEQISADSSGTFTINVPARDVRLVIAGAQSYFVKTDLPGRNLPGPKETIFADPLNGPELSKDWEKVLHEGNAGVWFIDGKLAVQGNHYGYAYARKKIGQDNISVQSLVMRAPTGAQDESGGSLLLFWENGQYVQALPGVNTQKFMYIVSGKGPLRGSPINTKMLPEWYGFYHNWVKISLQPDKIIFYSSSDGETWNKDAEMKREEPFKGAPQYVALGNGQRGENTMLQNVTQHFTAEGRQPVTFFGDFVMGKD